MFFRFLSLHTRLVIVFLLINGVSSCDENGNKSQELAHKFSGARMGTYYHVTLVGKYSDQQLDEINAGIESTLADIEGKMSTYISQSEISRFNKAPVDQWFPISEDSYNVILLSQEISKISGGAFDITVGPLVELWGFGAKPRIEEKPAAAEIEQLKEYLGYQHLQLQAKPPAVKKTRPVQIDLSAVAKGYGVDKVAEFLSARTVENYLVEVGGEIRVRGVNPKGGSWRVGIERPVAEERIPQRVIRLEQTAVATSGDYRNYFEVDGIRYSHTIDPVSGYPVTHTLASVTVVDPSSARADALATALNVLGIEKGLQLAETEHIAVYFIVRDKQGFIEKASSAMAPFLEQ